MIPQAVLIGWPAFDFATLTNVAARAVGYSPAGSADRCGRELTDAERFVSILAALGDSQAPAGLPPRLQAFVHFSVLLAVDEADAVTVAELAAMEFCCFDTVNRDVALMVLSGSLAQWHRAIRFGLEVESVRPCFSAILTQFEKASIGAWNDCKRKPTNDGFFRLEQK